MSVCRCCLDRLDHRPLGLMLVPQAVPIRASSSQESRVINRAYGLIGTGFIIWGQQLVVYIRYKLDVETREDFVEILPTKSQNKLSRTTVKGLDYNNLANYLGIRSIECHKDMMNALSIKQVPVKTTR